MADRRRVVVLILAGVMLAALTASSGISGAFSVAADNSGNRLTVKADLAPPTIHQAVVQKQQGGVPGYLGKDVGFRALADITDSGNPASGVALALASGQTWSNKALTESQRTAAGYEYNYATSLLGGIDIPAGAKSFAVAALDHAGNSSDIYNGAYTFDPDAPEPTEIEVEGSGDIPGAPDPGDRITFKYSERIDPGSLIGDWLSDPDLEFQDDWDGQVRDDITVRFESPRVYAPGPDAESLPIRLTVTTEDGQTVNLGVVEFPVGGWGVDCVASFEGSTLESLDEDQGFRLTLGEEADPGSVIYPSASDPYPDLVPTECA